MTKHPTGMELHNRLKAIAESHGGKYLTSNGENTRISHAGEFVCSAGHREKRRNLATIYGHWCNTCHLSNVAPAARLSVETINTRLAPSRVKLVSDWNGSRRPSRFECLECGSIWEEKGFNQLNFHYGCITCVLRPNMNGRVLISGPAKKASPIG